MDCNKIGNNVKSPEKMSAYKARQADGAYGKIYGLLILTFVIWGSLYVVSKYVLGKLPTFTTSFFRFSIAYITLTLIGKRRKATTVIAGKDIPWLLVLGIFGYFMSVGAQLLGTKYAGASMASLLNALNPVTMTFFGALILHEKLTIRKIAGLILALAGVYTILGDGIAVSGVGIAFSLFSVVLWSLISVLMRTVSQKYDSIQVTRYGVGIAAVCYFPIAVHEAIGGEISFDFPCVLALLYMSIVCTGIAYLLWNKCLSNLEAGVCSAFYPVQPMVSAFLGMIFLGEKTDLAFGLGSLLIVAGILINLSGGWKKRSKKR